MLQHVVAGLQNLRDIQFTSDRNRTLLRQLMAAADSRDQAALYGAAKELCAGSDVRARSFLIRGLTSDRYGRASALALSGLKDNNEIDQVVALRTQGAGRVAIRAGMVLSKLDPAAERLFKQKHPAVAAGLVSKMATERTLDGIFDSGRGFANEVPELAKIKDPIVRKLVEDATLNDRRAAARYVGARLAMNGEGAVEELGGYLGRCDVHTRNFVLHESGIAKFESAWPLFVPAVEAISRDHSTTDELLAARQGAELLLRIYRPDATEVAVRLFETYANSKLDHRARQYIALEIITELIPYFTPDQLADCLDAFEEGICDDINSHKASQKEYLDFARKCMQAFSAAGKLAFIYTPLFHDNLFSDARALILALPRGAKEDAHIANVFAGFDGPTDDEIKFRHQIAERMIDQGMVDQVVQASSVHKPWIPDEQDYASVAIADAALANRIHDRAVAVAVLAAAGPDVPKAFLSPLSDHWAYYASVNRLAVDVSTYAWVAPAMLPSPQHFVDAGFKFDAARYRLNSWFFQAQLPVGWTDHFIPGRGVTLYVDPEGTIRGAYYRVVIGEKELLVSQLWGFALPATIPVPYPPYLVDPSEWSDLYDTTFKDGDVVVVSEDDKPPRIERVRRLSDTFFLSLPDLDGERNLREVRPEQVLVRSLLPLEINTVGMWQVTDLVDRDPTRWLYGKRNLIPEKSPMSLKAYLEFERERQARLEQRQQRPKKRRRGLERDR